MDKDEKITTNKVETLKSQMLRLSEEVVCIENRPNGSAASTVAASTGSREHKQLCCTRDAKHFCGFPHRIERNGRGRRGRGGRCGRRNVHGTGITKPGTWSADLNKFIWDLTDRDQGNFDIKMMTFLWFNDGVTSHDRKRVQLDIQQTLARTPVEIKEDFVTATLELAPDKRPRNEAQAIFWCTMRDNAGLAKEQFDIRWVSTDIRVSVNSAPSGCLAVLSQLASITIGANQVLNRERLNSFLPRVTVDELQTILDDA